MSKPVMSLRLIFVSAVVCLAVQAQTPGPGSPAQPPLPIHRETVVIRDKVVEPAVDRKDGEVFRQTLFTRDDHVFHLLGAGINAGQHEGGGKSVEIRRFGFNLDHGGVAGGLKVLVDNVGVNQTTQGHGQGYLGSLKGLTPELVQDVDIINGPFSAQYGDFSGLGVVHIRQRESMPDVWTVRLQAGSFNARRAFIAFSPAWGNKDVLLAYEGALTDGPFLKPLDYARNNVTGHVGWASGDRDRWSVRWNAATNRFNSSGQIPLDEVVAGRLPRFGFIDPGDGGEVGNGTIGVYFARDYENGSLLKADAFATRSLFDLYSNFTFFLNDPVNGDAIQQHDSRLVEGANLQYLRPFRLGSVSSTLMAGANVHANQINVGLYSRVMRTPVDTVTSAHANVTNAAGYLQQDFATANGKLRAGAGLRWDVFRYNLRDRLQAETANRTEAALQPKANLAWRPSLRLPLTLHANYGRGISSLDARGIVNTFGADALSKTDFFQGGVSTNVQRWSLAASAFLIDRSRELVYIPDDGSLEFRGPTRSFGWELKSGVDLTRRLAFNGGVTMVQEAFYRGTEPRVMVDSAPRMVANAGLILTPWHGWSGSVRMRAINSYPLDGEDRTIRAAGHTVWDIGAARRITRNIDFSLTVDNLLDRDYYEMQNFFESRLPGQDPQFRIHATPGYGRTIMAGVTLRFGGK
jgi:outer membrane receptor protein involved in Fe transport